MSVIGTAFRRERVPVPVWAVVAGLLAAATAAAVPQAFGDASERRTLVELITATPSLLAIRGVPDGTDEGAYAFFEVFTYVGLVAGLMSVFLVTRQTRQDEDLGRTELLLATPVHRRTPVVVAGWVSGAANVLLGVLVALGFLAGGLPADGSALAGTAATCVGLAYTGIAVVVAQVAPTARATNAIGVGVVAVTYLLRAAGDAVGTRSADRLTVVSAWPSWLSPIGWGQHVFPFTRQDLVPLVPCLVVAVVGVVAALVVGGRRDLGASLLRERPGRAGGRMRTSLGLAWRLHRTTVIAWAVGGAVLGAFAGGLGTTAIDTIGDDPSVTKLLETLVPGGRGALLDEFVAAVVGITSILAAAAGIGALNRAAEDDREGRSELLLATPVGRVRRLAEWLGVGVGAAVLVAVATGAVGGLCFVATGSGTDRFWSTVAAGLAQLPAALVLVAFAAVLGVVLPRAAGWLVWVALGLALVLGQFGGLLRVPDWARQISPFTHTPGVPAAHIDWSGAWWLVATAVLLGAVALVLARRQEVSP
ncbi:ABC-2 type transport system permease protein [Curtobacterium pusillum]|uniref:ABC-2 type transport system permease protein n=1 Tax=Curtobacterium pusillum TaxID=69373 RepID=A0AAW3T1B3_9MICO|nr:ABC transporter permease subunit [Curtobacterium pusillum]MBA8989166.1 ABC-2 type transport system permease protein [Curtobacterium pusillum]